MVCFVHFDLETCFAPQWSALFRHPSFQKWSANSVLSTFWLGNVLRAATGCTFSTSYLPKVIHTPQFLLSWKCASRHNRVHFFGSSTSKIGLRMVSFGLGNVLRTTTPCNFSSLIWPAGSAPAALASLLFDPPEPQIIGKNTGKLDFPTFSCTSIFFLLTLSLPWSSRSFPSPLWLFPPLLFHLSILSEVWLLNFLR